MDEKMIAHHMRTLGCTREEAIALIQDDADVDRGIAKEWDLTPEQLKNQRKIANAKTRKPSGPVKRTKKDNPTKQAVIATVAKALEGYDNVVVANPERVVDFEVDGVRYSLTLTAHRK